MWKGLEQRTCTRKGVAIQLLPGNKLILGDWNEDKLQGWGIFLEEDIYLIFGNYEEGLCKETLFFHQQTLLYQVYLDQGLLKKIEIYKNLDSITIDLFRNQKCIKYSIYK